MKMLPESIALEKAIQSQKIYQGQLEFDRFERLKKSLAHVDGKVDYSLKFEKSYKILGKVEVTVTADLPLKCQISDKIFMHPVDVKAVVGFIDSLADEELLSSEMEAAIIEGGNIKPLELIEDELILLLPFVPVSPEEKLKEEKTHKITVFSEQEEDESNPFSVLKNLK